MNFKVCLFLLSASIALISCGKNEVILDDAINFFEFDFSKDAEGWVGDFADYPSGEEAFYELKAEYAALPAPLDGNNGALMLSGNNHSDDLFMFIKKKLTGLVPNKNYSVTFDIEIASNAANNSGGIGGSPGSSVFIKAGATNIEPKRELAGEGYYRMNIDKGNQAQSGSEMKVIDDFSNGTDEFEYQLKSLDDQTTFQVQADSDGVLWLIVGTDSGFEGKTTIYYSGIKVFLK